MSTTVIVILAIWFIGCFIAWFYIGKKYKNDFNLFSKIWFTIFWPLAIGLIIIKYLIFGIYKLFGKDVFTENSELKFNINLNVDTLEPKSIIKLKFDSGLRTACQIGFEYSPLDSFCNLIKLDYTVATPFTYTFYDNGEVFGFRNHINMGIPMALNIDPNSDRISLSMNFKPKNNFTVKTLTSFIRHGNPFESLSSEEVLSLNSKKYLSDGSQNASDGELETFCDYTNFLTQKSLLFVIQGYIDFEYAFYITKNQNLSFCCSYFFEFIKNDGVNNNIFTGRETTKEQVEESLNIWKENFKERYNHYFSVGVKYTF